MEPVNPQDWYWTLERWGNDILPSNVETIINIANNAIDEFVKSRPNITNVEMNAFCNDLWSEYCLYRWLPPEPPVYDFKGLSYLVLLQKALSPNATQIDIDTLGEWLACWGEGCMLDENCYSLGGNRYLYPIYSRWPDRYGVYNLLRYEIRWQPPYNFQ